MKIRSETIVNIISIISGLLFTLCYILPTIETTSAIDWIPYSFIMFVATSVSAYIINIPFTILSMILTYFKQRTTPIYIDNAYLKKFIIEYLPRGTKKEADVEVVNLKQISLKHGKIQFHQENTTLYILKTIYWNEHGGKSHYFKSKPVLTPGEETYVVADDNKKQKIIFTGELFVPPPPKTDSPKEYEEYIKKCNYFKKKTTNEINKIIQDKINFKYAAKLITDYRHHLNLKYSRELSFKKHPALTSALRIKRLSEELSKVDKKYKILLYKQSLYEELIPQLKLNTHISIDELDKMTIEELNAIIKANKIK